MFDVSFIASSTSESVVTIFTVLVVLKSTVTCCEGYKEYRAQGRLILSLKCRCHAGKQSVLAGAIAVGRNMCAVHYCRKESIQLSPVIE